MDTQEYKCSGCGKIKPLSEFHKRKNRAVGIASHCKDCHHQRYYDQKLWQERKAKRLYGIDPQEYDELYKNQKGLCAICGCAEGTNGRGRLAVDHNHNTGLVRGLLCFRCNTLIGSIEKTGNAKINEYLLR